MKLKQESEFLSGLSKNLLTPVDSDNMKLSLTTIAPWFITYVNGSNNFEPIFTGGGRVVAGHFSSENFGITRDWGLAFKWVDKKHSSKAFAFRLSPAHVLGYLRHNRKNLVHHYGIIKAIIHTGFVWQLQAKKVTAYYIASDYWCNDAAKIPHLCDETFMVKDVK